RARLRAERRTRRQRAGGAGRERHAARGHDGSVRLHLLHDDGVPRLPRHVRRDLDDVPVFHEGAAGQVLEAGLRRHRDGRPVLALRRPGMDHPVHHRLPDLRGYGDRTQASQLHPHLGVSGGPHGRRAGARLRAANLAQPEAPVAPVLGGVEGSSGRAVFHAPEVRALEPAEHGDHSAAARRDLHLGGDVGAHLVAFLELTKPRITQLVLLTAAAGFYLGSRGGVDVGLLVRTLIGVALVAAGTNVFNQVRERDVDARMRRTERRPLPHFLALAWIYREDYRRGGLAMLSVADPDGHDTGRMVLLYAMALLPVSLLPTLLGVTGPLYFWGALALGVGYAGVAVAMTRA